MRKTIFNYIMVSTVLVFSACTDLEVVETDSIITAPLGEFEGVDAAANLTSGYNDLNLQNTQEGLYSLSVATTDEVFIPTRGTDWGDNGVWRDLATHGWSGAHSFNLNTWNFLNSAVYRSNQILHPKTTKTALQEAEAKFLRAYYMFWIVDLWRQVPFRTADEGADVNPTVLTATEAVDFIIADLEDALPLVPTVTANSIASQNRASKASVNFLLAKVYLNKHIYTDQTTPDPADMDKVIAAVDAIIADGYTLQDGFFGIFAPSADSETILWSNGQYASRIWGGLHYNQGRETDNGGGGWNGFATTAEFFDKFEGDPNTNLVGGNQEERRGYVPNNALGIGFLIGTQYGPIDAAHPDGKVLARSGQPLVFTKDVPSLTGNPDYTGVRVLKYHPTINMPGSWGNHLMLMRYADAHLMKAEALFRKSQTAAAKVLVDELRALRGASTLATLTEQEILDERGRELYIEGWRRNDLVRFEQFNASFGFNDNNDVTRNVFPIPDLAIGSNPNLKQNPGY